MAWLSPTNPLDPVTGLPNGAVLVVNNLNYQQTRPVLTQTVLAAPAFSQLINTTQGRTV